MPTTEHTINDALAAVLRGTRLAWREVNVVSSENTGMLKGSSKRPDILVTEANVSPVVIEAEVFPATTVERDAINRLSEKIRATGQTILSSIAVRLPQKLRTTPPAKLQTEIAEASDLDIALYTGSTAATATRWPSSGWIRGSVPDLSILTQSASVPPDVIEAAAENLVTGVIESAGLLKGMVRTNPGAIHKISAELKQEDGEQTRRMAATILANAFVFQEGVAGGPAELAEVKSLDELHDGETINKSALLAEWRKILKVNYWPIFDIARRILEVIPSAQSKPLIECLSSTAGKLIENRLMRSHDLTGAVFQRLIADRKFLAAFYTTPASASLLAGLAITPRRTPSGGSWENAEDVKNLRIADFACGTGTLLSTAYLRIGQLHELAGGNIEALHHDMMASSLIGCDVLPAATHLTASILAGAHPAVKYQKSSILTVAYGMQPGGGVALGSLDLLDPQKPMEFLKITAKAAWSMGENEQKTWSALPNSSFDVVIMNPPFTRDTGHEGEKIGVPHPMFAAFSTKGTEQKLMANTTKALTQGTSAHGNAGEASIFLVLSDRMLKPNGMLALVMPLSLMSGDAWEGSRALLKERYGDLVLVSIVGTEGGELSFSADTGMGECLVVARRAATGSTRAAFLVLDKRPAFPMLGASAARQMRQLIEGSKLKKLEDGPVGGTPLRFGDDTIGQALDAPLPPSGGWNLSRIADLALAQTAYQMTSKGRVWLPSMNAAEAVDIPITVVSAIGEIGPYHMDINGKTSTGGIRGPFSIVKIKPKSAPTYPVLWSHDAHREKTLLFKPDSEGLSLKGTTSAEQTKVEKKVARVWATASHCHFNRDFQFNSQPMAMQFTPQRAIGGRAWLSIQLSTDKQEKALVVWGNSTIGLLLHWWHSNKQQVGRGSITKASLQGLPVLDVTALPHKKLAAAAKLFDDMNKKPFLPLHKIDKDPVRQELDEKFARRVLGLPKSVFGSGGALELLRRKLAQEPSIRGHKT